MSHGTLPLIINGKTHIANGGRITQRETEKCTVWEVQVAPQTLCEQATTDGHIPHAEELLAGPLDYCHICTAIAVLLT